jgi:DnaJ family protein C protein 17
MSEIKNKELLEKDLYQLLDIEDESCTIEQIKKAYRRRALELHPDKNLGNKEEAERNFIELGRVFEILSDKSARSAYDAVRRARRDKAKRDELLDDKRRKLKEQLESREQAFRNKTQQIKKNKEEDLLAKEIERLRREGSKLLDEEMNFVNEQVRLESKKRAKTSAAAAAAAPSNADTGGESTSVPRIKIAWSLDFLRSDGTKKLDEELLRHLFSKYGQIEVLVVSQKSTAILEFKRNSDAFECLKDAGVLNRMYSITLKCLGEKTPTTKQSKRETVIESNSKTNDVNLFEETTSFEDMEMAILKKLKSASN